MRPVISRGLLVATIGFAFAQPGFAQEVDKKEPLKNCRVKGIAQEVKCGTITRALNPEQPDGKKIDVHFAVIPSQDKNKLPDPVVLLAGGPGQSAIQAAGYAGAVFGKLNTRRDILLVDQRGTGKSASLDCPDLNENTKIQTFKETINAIAACRDQLSKQAHGELQYYTTTIAMQDLEAVRTQLGYQQLNLVGVSYGTRAGLEYARQFPQSVRRLILDGVVPPELTMSGPDGYASLSSLFEFCKKDERCQKAYPDLEPRWQKLLQRPAQKVTITHPRTGQSIALTIDSNALISNVHRALYSPVSAAQLPYALTQAEAGRFEPLLTLAGATSHPTDMRLFFGMHLSVFCAEGYGETAKKERESSNEFSRYFGEFYREACAIWPKGKVPSDFYTINPLKSPTLLLSGGIDPVTPKRHGDFVKKALGDQAQHLVVENLGHGLLVQGCVADVARRFISVKSNEEALKLDTSCIRQVPRPLVWLPPKSIQE